MEQADNEADGLIINKTNLPLSPRLHSLLLSCLRKQHNGATVTWRFCIYERPTVLPVKRIEVRQITTDPREHEDGPYLDARIFIFFVNKDYPKAGSTEISIAFNDDKVEFCYNEHASVYWSLNPEALSLDRVCSYA